MLNRGDLYLFSAEEIRNPVPGVLGAEQHEAMLTVSDWAARFLSRPHPDLGRIGPVCPYTQSAFGAQLVFMSCPDLQEASVAELSDVVHQYRDWFGELREMTTDGQGHLLTILIVLPHLDRSSSACIDHVHALLKDGFVDHGLMIGQFHPKCEQAGLWNEDFRPLQSPVPLFAIREMVSSDLPFLVGSPDHAREYLERFATDIPSHTRRFLVDRIASTRG